MLKWQCNNEYSFHEIVITKRKGNQGAAKYLVTWMQLQVSGTHNGGYSHPSAESTSANSVRDSGESKLSSKLGNSIISPSSVDTSVDKEEYGNDEDDDEEDDDFSSSIAAALAAAARTSAGDVDTGRGRDSVS
ncbi:hypothetical protein RJ639_040915 [Escallonia herrerae]|uniref:Uncharacterized protein n=1 Tax=Escallonia herrerae TaxID=1293975 RepID=A0AA88WKW6_9ASTE|nr:hypothetical protein RJ639_040915 [Escallonia herrerae]